MTEKARTERLFSKLPRDLKDSLWRLSYFYQCRLKEIRLRIGQPVLLDLGDEQVFLSADGNISKQPASDNLIMHPALLEQTFLLLCGQSVQCYEEELKHGFFTIQDGHRVGVFGTTFTVDHVVQGIQHISSLNIRLARQIFGVAEPIFHTVLEEKLQSILIVGPPNSGKTTLLRDLVRGISTNRLDRSYKTVILDERGELSAMQNGQSQYDLGYNTDIYHLCPKAQAMEMALRAGSPEVMICDEIGSVDDTKMLLTNMLAGVCIIATAHAKSIEQLQAREQIHLLLQQQVFDHVILLQDGSNPCKVQAVYRGAELCD